jgi:hypothetical protein
MVCNEKASEEEITKLDEQIRGFASRRSAFSRQQDVRTVESTNTAMVSVINREVETINRIADGLLADIDKIEQEAKAHKRVHQLAWAKNGMPKGDDEDFQGVRLGDAMENVLKMRRDAVQTVRGNQLSKVPLIVEPVVEEEAELSEEQLIRMALDARKKG